MDATGPECPALPCHPLLNLHKGVQGGLLHDKGGGGSRAFYPHLNCEDHSVKSASLGIVKTCMTAVSHGRACSPSEICVHTL